MKNPSTFSWFINATLDALVWALDVALENAANEKLKSQRTVDEYYKQLRNSQKQ